MEEASLDAAVAMAVPPLLQAAAVVVEAADSEMQVSLCYVRPDRPRVVFKSQELDAIKQTSHI